MAGKRRLFLFGADLAIRRVRPEIGLSDPRNGASLIGETAATASDAENRQRITQ